ncbi:hypothetical protein LDK15_08130 [Fusobacterium nucleatum]|uniref:hypothetical protein n=1 Tax=Fusobacterium nucleatum TaxID=851 RepID=UPI0030D52F63
MAVEVNLEKYGHRKKGFLGFSWTSFFFGFFVPIFRVDLVGFLIFVSPYLLMIMDLFVIGTGINDRDTVTIAIAIIISILSVILRIITNLILPFIYNRFYTKSLLKKGYLPPEDDDYSNAILKGNRYLEYTNKDLLDKEKMERYRLIIEEYEKERKNNNITLIIFFGSLIFIIVFFIFMASY